MKQADLGFDTTMQRTFLKRTSQAYRNLVQRLAEKRDKNERIIRRGRELPFSLVDFRERFAYKFDENWQAHCVYCERFITPASFQLEHPVPLVRGGSLGLDNLALSCDDCNRIKGQLLPLEFKALRDGLRTFPEAAQRDILGRLRGQMRFLRPKSNTEAKQSLCQQK